MKKKKKSNSIVLVIFLAVLGYIGYKTYVDFKDYNEAWKVEITATSVNVRKGASIHDTKIAELGRGKKYKVLEVYLEDKNYVWYNIEYKKGQNGWIASDRNNPFVREINNPENDEEGPVIIDYKAPIIKYYEDTYSTLNIRTIKYDHLTIIEDSEYVIKHNIYFEEFPTDRDGHQYWIEYIVTDVFGNSASTVQRIEFQNEPGSSEVLDFKVLKEKRGR